MQQGSQDMRKHMRVLVAVKVRQRDSARLDLADLRFHFLLNFLGGNLLANRGDSKFLQAGAKTGRAICKRSKICLEWHAIDQDHVASSLEARLRLG